MSRRRTAGKAPSFNWIRYCLPNTRDPEVLALDKLVPAETGESYLPAFERSGSPLYLHFYGWAMSGGKIPEEDDFYRDLRAALFPHENPPGGKPGVDWLRGKIPRVHPQALLMLEDVLPPYVRREMGVQLEAVRRYCATPTLDVVSLSRAALLRAVWGTPPILDVVEPSLRRGLDSERFWFSNWPYDLLSRFRWAVWAHAWSPILNAQDSAREVVKSVQSRLTKFTQSFSILSEEAERRGGVCPPFANSDIKLYAKSLSQSVQAREGAQTARGEYLRFVEWLSQALLAGEPSGVGFGGHDVCLREEVMGLLEPLLSPWLKDLTKDPDGAKEVTSRILEDCSRRFVSVTRMTPVPVRRGLAESAEPSGTDWRGRVVLDAPYIYVGRENGTFARQKLKSRAPVGGEVLAAVLQNDRTAGKLETGSLYRLKMASPAKFVIKRIRDALGRSRGGSKSRAFQMFEEEEGSFKFDPARIYEQRVSGGEESEVRPMGKPALIEYENSKWLDESRLAYELGRTERSLRTWRKRGPITLRKVRIGELIYWLCPNDVRIVALLQLVVKRDLRSRVTKVSTAQLNRSIRGTDEIPENSKLWEHRRLVYLLRHALTRGFSWSAENVDLEAIEPYLDRLPGRPD